MVVGGLVERLHIIMSIVMLSSDLIMRYSCILKDVLLKKILLLYGRVQTLNIDGRVQTMSIYDRVQTMNLYSRVQLFIVTRTVSCQCQLLLF